MNIHNLNILFFTRTMGLGGTENVIIQLCEILKPHVNKIIVCSCNGVNEEKLSEMGIKHYSIPDIENKNIKILISVAKELKKIVIDENITVIHTHHRMAAFYIMLIGLYKRCKFINTSHNTFRDHILLTKFAYKKCRLIACGNAVRDNLISTYGLKNIVVIHNAIKPFCDNVISENEIEAMRKNGDYIIANVGRLSKQKGMDYFIKAIPNVIQLYPNCKFVIIGSGEEEKHLKELCEKMNIIEQVLFMGYRRDVQNLLSQVDLVVLSSLWEGFPLTPIEAFSVGKTVIATGVDGTLEIIENGKNGILVEPRNSDMISDAIIWLYEHPNEKKQMEDNAKLSFQTKFSLQRFSNEYINFYRSL